MHPRFCLVAPNSVLAFPCLAKEKLACERKSGIETVELQASNADKLFLFFPVKCSIIINIITWYHINNSTFLCHAFLCFVLFSFCFVCAT